MPYARCMKSKCCSAVRCCLGGKSSVTSACFPFLRVISWLLKLCSLCNIILEPNCDFKGNIHIFLILTRSAFICCPSVASIKINKQKAYTHTCIYIYIFQICSAIVMWVTPFLSQKQRNRKVEKQKAANSQIHTTHSFPISFPLAFYHFRKPLVSLFP